MPLEIKMPVKESDIINVIYLWLDLLAGEKYEEAYNLTMQDPYYQWTPNLIEQMINGYGFPVEKDRKVKYKVSNGKLAKSNFQSSKPYKEVNFLDDKLEHFLDGFFIIGNVHFDLPLNDEWSDLTATFDILENNDCIFLELNEIHVF